MPFARPGLTDLRRQVASDINASLPGVDALLRFSNIGILGDVLAALANGQYGYGDWIARQSTPFTATDEYLEGWAGLKGVTRKPAAPAVGKVTFVAAGGATIPAGTAVNRSDGVSYATTDEASAEDGTIVVAVRATAGSEDSNAAVGTGMTLATGISGVQVSGSVSQALIGGADIEPDDELRSRMLAVYAAPPQGGSITDYPSWALAVPGVTRCWARPGALGAGTIALFFMMDDVRADHGGFPQGANGCASYEQRDTTATGDQLLVADAVFPLQSVIALVYAVAPTPNRLTLTLAGLSGASASLRDAISGAVAAALLVAAVPGGITNVSAIEAAIASVPGTAGFVLTAVQASAGSVAPGAAGNITSEAGALPVLDGIVYA